MFRHDYQSLRDPAEMIGIREDREGGEGLFATLEPCSQDQFRANSRGVTLGDDQQVPTRRDHWAATPSSPEALPSLWLNVTSPRVRSSRRSRTV